jgi:hypothetical protein
MIAPPLAVLATATNQHSRFAAIAFPGLALVLAGLSRMAMPRLFRVSALAVVLLIGVGQVAAQFPPGSEIQRQANVAIQTSSFGNVMLLAPYYPAADPGGDDATPVMQQLETIAQGRPMKVLVAEEDHVFNKFTLLWVAAVRHDQFSFNHPMVLSGDPAELNSYAAAIYLPAAEVDQRNADPRVQIQRIHILNEEVATTVYGDQLFQIFGGGRYEVVLGDGTIVWVLVRRSTGS